MEKVTRRHISVKEKEDFPNRAAPECDTLSVEVASTRS